MIEVCNLSKTFVHSRRREVNAVRSATFAVNKGEIFGLLGPNGAGKTTLLRMLGTIITATEGYCAVGGVRSNDNPERVRREIGFLSGNTKLYKRLTARETLRYFGRLYGMTEKKISERIEEVTELFDMTEFIDRRCESFSTGQQQRVSISRVIMHDPEVLILDEPTLGLDIMSSRTILKFVTDARDRGRSIIFSTHYMTEAELICDRIGFIHNGQILAIGAKEQLYRQTNTDNLQDAFLSMAGAEDVI